MVISKLVYLPVSYSSVTCIYLTFDLIILMKIQM